MEKIYFDNSTYIWKNKLNMLNEKKNLLDSINNIISSYKNNNDFTDAYPYLNGTSDKIDNVLNAGVTFCKSLYNETNKIYNKIYTETWINVVRSKTPFQYSFIKKDNEVYQLSNDKNRYHTHTEIKKMQKGFYPHYTFVYYIQMPDIMEGEDGVLYLKGDFDKEYWIRPEEDDLIIMEGTVPHNPNNAPKSNLDRIVIAGNVGFEFIKNQKSII